jgi:hypothetical protein
VSRERKIRMSELFETLEPPSGGLGRLRARLSEEQDARVFNRVGRLLRPATGFRLVLTATALGAALLVLTLHARTAPRVDLSAALQVRTGNIAEPARVRDGQLAALQRLASSNPQVALYRVAILDPASAPPPDSEP